MTEVTRRPALHTTVITGYLGAGKTTLINNLLAGDHGLRITVLVNDFGEIAVDESLIKNRDGETLTLSNGCICCSIGGALYDSIDQILEAPLRPDHLVIETSGVADPSKVSEIAVAEPDLAYRGTLCLMDCLNLENQLADPLLRDTLERQMRGSQVLIFTKTDVHKDRQELENLRERVLGMHHEAARTSRQQRPADERIQSMYDSIQGDLGTDIILGNHATKTETPANPLKPQENLQSGLAGSARLSRHGHIYHSWSGALPAPFAAEMLEQLTRTDESGIYRAKGFICTPDGNWLEIHRVGKQWTVKAVEAPERTAKQPNGYHGHLVAIGFADRFSPEAFGKRINQANRTVQSA